LLALRNALSFAQLGIRPKRTETSHPSFFSSTFRIGIKRRYITTADFKWKLSRFLTAYPEYQKKFTKFADVPQSDLLSNGNFLAQAYTILAGLNVVIQSLSSQELMANQLNALGGAHQPRGVTTAMFKVSYRIISQQMRRIQTEYLNFNVRNLESFLFEFSKKKLGVQ